jgi:hypothetical protein
MLLVNFKQAILLLPIQVCPGHSYSLGNNMEASAETHLYIYCYIANVINLLTADGLKSNCPHSGIRYIPKTSPHHPKPVPTTSNGGSRPTDSPDVKKGYLKVSTLNQRRGCLISMGSWFSSGTCATFRVLESTNGKNGKKENA